jgi:DNA-binding response OmpR family regulator
MSKHVLIVDDDALLCAGVAFSLQRVGYTTTIAGTAEEALEIVRQQHPDVILLDIGLPGMDGLEALRAVQQKVAIPVIFVTARRRELDEIVGLELGADDYITKPFDMDVLLARIKAVLRRASVHTEFPTGPITVGDLQIDPGSHVVRVGEATIELSPKEFAILLVLAQEANRAVSTDELIRRVWGADWVGEIQTVYVHMRWLREKIERDPTQPRRLVTS